MSNAIFDLESGMKYPYDAYEDGTVRQGDYADRIARGIINNLCDRRNIKWGFEHVDQDVRCEIVETLATIVREGEKEKLADALRRETMAIESQHELEAEVARLKSALEKVLTTSGKEEQSFDDFNIIRYVARKALTDITKNNPVISELRGNIADSEITGAKDDILRDKP